MHWLDSPFLIPIAAFAMVLGIVIAKEIAEYHVRRLKTEERLAAIAKGVPLPPDLALEDGHPERSLTPEERERHARGLRTGGIACIAVGIGLALFSFALTAIVHQRDVLAVAAAGIIPFAVGVGLVVDYKLRTRAPQPEGKALSELP